MFNLRPHGFNAPGASRVGVVPSLSMRSTRPFAGFPHVHCQLWCLASLPGELASAASLGPWEATLSSNPMTASVKVSRCPGWLGGKPRLATSDP